MDVKKETYTCAECGGVFEKVWSDEEAMQEAAELHGIEKSDIDGPFVVVVCDDCFQEQRKRFGF